MIHLADCREYLAQLDDDSVDACVTDPPYELGFMGKSWDRTGIAYDPAVWAHVLRVLKPGGHVVAFGGSRTYHRLGTAIEDAGFAIRDSLLWLYGTGFPKSLDVGKAIDKSAGATPEAQQWQGYGTALKPAHEPAVLARKPFKGTVASNVLAHGTGGLNIDGCRVSVGKRVPGGGKSKRGARGGGIYGDGAAEQNASPHSNGRWPANVAHDGSAPVLAGLDSAARFFYCAKASKAEREAGLDAGRKSGRRNIHPTVKPIALMRWLVRLVTPPGGLVLDPFCGSGTTGCAAALEGLRFIGCELDPRYAAIANARMANHAPGVVEVPAGTINF